MYKFLIENVYSNMFFFLSHTYLKENVFTKIFNVNVYTKGFFEKNICTKIWYIYKISKDNVSTNF